MIGFIKKESQQFRLSDLIVYLVALVKRRLMMRFLPEQVKETVVSGWWLVVSEEWKVEELMKSSDSSLTTNHQPLTTISLPTF
ncbi:MAG: hypothetical protein U0Z53_11925 [Blastocatellia bacterium]